MTNSKASNTITDKQLMDLASFVSITDKQLMDLASFVSGWPPYRRKELVILVMSVDLGRASVEKTLFKNMTKLQEAKEND
jgi:hypothetical protein